MNRLERVALFAVVGLCCAAAPSKKPPDVDWGNLASGGDRAAAAKSARAAVGRLGQYVDQLQAALPALEERAGAGEATEDLLRSVMGLVHDCTAASDQLSQGGAAIADLPAGNPDVAEGSQEAAAALEKAQTLAVAALALADQLSAKVEVAGPPPGTPSQMAPTDADLVVASLTPAAERAAKDLAKSLAAFRTRKLLVSQVTVIETREKPKAPALGALRFDPQSVRARAFSLILYQELSKAGFQSTAVADPGPLLRSSPPDVDDRPAREFTLVYGVVALQPHQHVAWTLRAVDLNGGAVLATTQNVVEAEKPRR